MKLSLLFGLVSVTGCAASSPPAASASSAAAELAQAVCERAQSCDAAGFASKFPGGLGDCEAKFPKPTGAAACSSAAYDACAGDVRQEACDVLASGTLPHSCDGC